jgi:hypothetical protein
MAMMTCSLSVLAFIAFDYHCYMNPTVDCIPRLIATFNDNYSVLHNDVTLSTEALMQLGEPAIEPVLDFLRSDKFIVRFRAWRVLRYITAKMFDANGDKASEAQVARWKKYWAEHGDLKYDDPPEKYKAVAKKWKKMIAAERMRK